MQLDWIRWTIRTGPLVGPLVGAPVEHLVGDLGRYALEKTAFMSSWKALSWQELARGRAAGCGWVTRVAARPVTRGGVGLGAGRSRREPPWFCDGPVPPCRQINRATDRSGLAHRARDDGDEMTEHEGRSFYGEAGSPTP